MREDEFFFERLMTLRQRAIALFWRTGTKSVHSAIRMADLVGIVLYGDFLELYYLPLTAMITPPATIRLPPRKMGRVGI